jgi:hypothetical protein
VNDCRGRPWASPQSSRAVLPNGTSTWAEVAGRAISGLPRTAALRVDVRTVVNPTPQARIPCIENRCSPVQLDAERAVSSRGAYGTRRCATRPQPVRSKPIQTRRSAT